MTRPSRFWALALVGVLPLVALSCGLFAPQTAHDQVPLAAIPSPEGQVVTYLPQGQPLTIQARTADEADLGGTRAPWYWAAVPGGTEGWVHGSALAGVNPQAVPPWSVGPSMAFGAATVRVVNVSMEKRYELSFWTGDRGPAAAWVTLTSGRLVNGTYPSPADAGLRTASAPQGPPATPFPVVVRITADHLDLDTLVALGPAAEGRPPRLQALHYSGPYQWVGTGR